MPDTPTPPAAVRRFAMIDEQGALYVPFVGPFLAVNRRVARGVAAMLTDMTGRRFTARALSVRYFLVAFGPVIPRDRSQDAAQ